MSAANLTSNLKTEIVPAILVKTRADLIKRIEAVKQYVKTIQIDVMDNDFVPNRTIGMEDLQNLPDGINYEFHWMVQNPQNWIEKIEGKCLHLVHVEARMDFGAVKKAARAKGAKVGIAVNPPTEVEKLFEYEKQVSQILVMSVNPGFSGQEYIESIEKKIHILRQRNPTINIEVDGGINAETIVGAARAGANKLCAASAIFASPDIKSAIDRLMLIADGARYGKNY